jgi:5-methylcytosine-specific restriction endonuclease McrA
MSLPREEASRKRPDFRSSDFSGEHHKTKETRPDSDPDVCAYCGALNPETVEHILARVSFYDLLKEKGLSEQEAKDGADAIENLIKVCGRCNSSKSSRTLGTEWLPKNPNDLVKYLIDLAKNPNTRNLLLNLATAHHRGGIGGLGAAEAIRKCSPQKGFVCGF